MSFKLVAFSLTWISLMISSRLHQLIASMKSCAWDSTVVQFPCLPSLLTNLYIKTSTSLNILGTETYKNVDTDFSSSGNWRPNSSYAMQHCNDFPWLPCFVFSSFLLFFLAVSMLLWLPTSKTHSERRRNSLSSREGVVSPFKCQWSVQNRHYSVNNQPKWLKKCMDALYVKNRKNSNICNRGCPWS